MQAFLFLIFSGNSTYEPPNIFLDLLILTSVLMIPAKTPPLPLLFISSRCFMKASTISLTMVSILLTLVKTLISELKYTALYSSLLYVPLSNISK